MADYILRVLTPEQANAIFATKAELAELEGDASFAGNADNITDGAFKVIMLATERAKLANISSNATANDDDASLRNRATHTGTQPASTITGLSPVAVSGSYADLTGTIPASALPPLAITDVFPVFGQTAMLALTAQRGDVAKRTDTGEAFILAAEPASTLANWVALGGGSGGGAVSSVAGKTGVVTLVKSDVGLSNVDNTADSAKPISSSVQTALDGKVNTTRQVAGKPLTSDVTLVKGDVGLNAVDNTADTAKPVSTPQQTALNAKANIASPVFTGTPSGPTPSDLDNSTRLATTEFVKTALSSSVWYGTQAQYDALGSYTDYIFYAIKD